MRIPTTRHEPHKLGRYPRASAASSVEQSSRRFDTQDYGYDPGCCTRATSPALHLRLMGLAVTGNAMRQDYHVKGPRDGTTNAAHARKPHPSRLFHISRSRAQHNEPHSIPELGKEDRCVALSLLLIKASDSHFCSAYRTFVNLRQTDPTIYSRLSRLGASFCGPLLSVQPGPRTGQPRSPLFT